MYLPCSVQSCMSACVSPQIAEGEEEVLRLRAQAVALQGDLKAQSAQLESGDDALSALSQSLRHTQQQLQHSRQHAQECEMVITTLRHSSAALRRQVSPSARAHSRSVRCDLHVTRTVNVDGKQNGFIVFSPGVVILKTNVTKYTFI